MKDEFWGLIIVYVPFVMGGDVWQPRRFLAHGERRVLKTQRNGKIRAYDFDVFLWESDGVWCCYEKVTGGLLGHGDTKEAAYDKAVENVKITPDLREQMDRQGDVKNSLEITLAEAKKLLRKSRDEERAGRR